MKAYILLLFVFLVGCAVQEPVVEEVQVEEPVVEVVEEVVEELVVKEVPVVEEPVVKEFNIIAKRWDFTPGTITVQKGDNVKLSIESIDVRHGIAIPAFNINQQLNPGETTIIEFTADKEGSFRFFCSVLCGAGHSGMDGTLIVTT